MDVAVIGGGNLGCAVAKALAKRYRVVVTRRNVEKIRFLEDVGCEVCSDNVRAVDNSDVVFIAVKPKDVFDVLSELKDNLRDKILVSFVAGVKIDEIKDTVSCKVVRAMTNISAEVGSSITAYYTQDLTPEEEFELELMLECMGDVVRVDYEKLLDAITDYSSAVAFMAKIFQSFVYAGLKLGLSKELAKKMTVGLFKGASELLDLEEPEAVIERVTTPAGTTIEGLCKLMEHRIDFGIVEAMISSAEKLSKR
jgi:pyrroline-5-carboxylate reductase